MSKWKCTSVSMVGQSVFVKLSLDNLDITIHDFGDKSNLTSRFKVGQMYSLSLDNAPLEIEG